MSSEVEAAIMDSPFEYLRTSESCRYWTKQTVKMRYFALWADFLQRYSENDSPRAGPCRSAGLELRTFGTNASALANVRAPGCTVLHKVVDNARICGISPLFDESGDIEDLAVLSSRTPSDFSGGESLFYFTSDYKVAEYHAAYAKRRIGAGRVSIISMAIPNAVLEQMQSTGELVHLFWPSDEWKETVWLSRRHRPSRLDLDDQAKLAIGTTARRPNGAYHQMRSFDEVTEDYVFKADHMNPDAAPSVQYVFRFDNENFLEEHAAQTMRATPFVDSDLAAWLQTYGSASTIST
ncbi:hypothetical protein CMUS01_03423 [Colletotrichum musicola]|uniref:Uncharacterized protein n=1 Tax=Colletotrichum musicola TaxID=2175873 RepID=A0A8H6NSR2_9PEZI|nr:hypothetical protein CMUS01_03423 [Colletotrichum musicola]